MKWFKHDSNANTDAKLKRVRMKYGMQGYGLYWYCLEIEERKKRYRAMILERGGRCLRTSIEQIQSIAGILAVRRELALRPLTVRGWLAYFKRRKRKINAKTTAKAEVEFESQQLQDWEDEVRQRLVYSS